MARAFKIEFDTLPGHNPNTGATLSAAMLNPYGWRSIGATRGGQFANQTGGDITSISLKANNPGDTFDIIPESAGRLFATVWLKNDQTETIFMDANIPVNPRASSTTGVFWMRVPRNDEDDIDRCDNQGQCPFRGKVFPRNPPDPPASSWRRIRSDFRTLNDRWRALMAACPSEFREIQTYGESPDGQYTAFLANGNLLLFDAVAGAVSVLDARHTALSLVNHISFRDGEFVLASNGTSIQSIGIRPDRSRFSEVGRAPGNVSTQAKRRNKGSI
jgi:hypothetical protein